jgi:hypothetical protein
LHEIAGALWPHAAGTVNSHLCIARIRNPFARLKRLLSEVSSCEECHASVPLDGRPEPRRGRAHPLR